MSSSDKKLSEFIRQFAKLRTDRSANWGAATKDQAPHKPFLLLSVLDLFAEGQLPSNLIEITPELGELFSAYWEIVLPERRGERSRRRVRPPAGEKAIASSSARWPNSRPATK